MSAKDDIRQLADKYAAKLKQQIDGRVHEMKDDDTSHYLIYCECSARLRVQRRL